MIITTMQLKNLKEEDVGKILCDRGLRGKVGKSDKGILVDFSLRYVISKKQYELSLGRWPNRNLSEIRASKNEAQSQLKNGLIPHLERKKAKQKLVEELEAAKKTDDRMTVSMLFSNWLTKKLKHHKDSKISFNY